MSFPLKKLFHYLAIFTIFTGAWSYQFFTPFLGYTDFRILYIFILVLTALWLPFLADGIYINRTFVYLFLLIILISLVCVFYGINSVSGLLKQLVGISSSALFFYILIRINNYDVKRLFNIYLNIAFIIALIGIIQEASFLLKFRPGYDYSSFIPTWKIAYSKGDYGFLAINSILTEPSHFCNVMMPAFFTSLVSFFKNSFKFQSLWKRLIIIVAFLFSFSTMGYIGLLLAIAIFIFSRPSIKKIIIGLVLVTLTFTLLYRNVYNFRYRVQDSVRVLKGEIEIEKASPSVFAIVSNSLIAYESFKRNPLFGSGLGSHETTYRAHIDRLLNRKKFISSYNPREAASLFLRLLSETGLLGLAIMFVFIFRFYIRRKDTYMSQLWIINNAILLMFMIKLIRMGHYFVDGFFLFIWLYYFSKLQYKEEQKNIEVKNNESITHTA